MTITQKQLTVLTILNGIIMFIIFLLTTTTTNGRIGIYITHFISRSFQIVPFLAGRHDLAKLSCFVGCFLLLIGLFVGCQLLHVKQMLLQSFQNSISTNSELDWALFVERMIWYVKL
jgi:uncharacterized membrane protein YiaA